MRYNKLYKIMVSAAFIATGLTSCDFLEVVPVEQPTIEDASKRPELTLGYLYSCYSGLNNWNPVDYMNEDVSSTDEYVLPPFSNWSANSFKIQTNQASSATGGDWHWRYCGYDHIRICHLFLEALKTAPGLTDEQRTVWAAEAKGLIAYYHFMVLRKYGPCPIIDRAMPQDIQGSDMPGRSHYDAVTKYIVDLLDNEVIPNLPDRWNEGDWGRIDKAIAKTIKARALLYAASPLWNGNDMYESGRLAWKNTTWETPGYGKQLVDPVYKVEKWEAAREACQEALDFALEHDFALYTEENFSELNEEPLKSAHDLIKNAMKYVLRMRYAVQSRANATGNCKELVWGTPKQTYIRLGCMPRRLFKKTDGVWVDGWSGVAPTLEAVEKFYTRRGYPIDKDKKFTEPTDRYKVGDYSHTFYYCPRYGASLQFDEIIWLNTNREPRFYAWLGFNGGEYGTRLINGKPLVLHMRDKDTQGYNPEISNRDYCRTGYLCQKWVHPGLSYATSGSDNSGSYTSPRPLIRMAELYLNLAECEAALGHKDAFRAAINPVRKRAGVPEITDELETNIKPGETMSMTDWVRNERFIEFYGEGIRFYDMRRWKEGAKSLGQKLHGLNMTEVVGPSMEVFNQKIVIPEYVDVAWDDRMYIMPLYFEEVDKSENLIQAPGY